MSERLRGRVQQARTAQRERPAGPAAAPAGKPAVPGTTPVEQQTVAVAGTAAAAAVEAMMERAAVIADLRRLREQFATALGRGGDADQLLRDIFTELRRVPDLLKDDVDPLTILGAAMTCAQLRLRPGVNGQCWILPFWNDRRRVREASFVIGYKGLVKLGFQSRLLRGLSARTVFEHDRFSFRSEHDGDKMMHEPKLRGDRGRPHLYYARALMVEGGYQLTEPTNHEDMLDHRRRHVKIQSGPWYDDRGVPSCGFEWMAWKTMIKRLSKTLPLDSNMAMAIEADEGVRTDTNPTADLDKVTERERDEAIPGQAWETHGVDWSDVPGATPATSRKGAPGE